MLPSVRETDSLANFRSDPERLLERLRRLGEPILLTDEGENGVVLQDARCYQQFLEEVDRLETVAAVKEGMRDMAAGRTRPMREALGELAIKHRLPPAEDD